MTGIYIRITAATTLRGRKPRGYMITDRRGVDLLAHRVRVYQCDGDALLSMIMGDGEAWTVRVNGTLLVQPENDGLRPVVLHVGDTIEIDGRNTGAAWSHVPLPVESRGVRTYTIAEIGSVDSYVCAVASLRHLLDGNVNTDAIPHVERALAMMTSGSDSMPPGD